MAFYDSSFFDNGDINLPKGNHPGPQIMIRFTGGNPRSLRPLPACLPELCLHLFDLGEAPPHLGPSVP